MTNRIRFRWRRLAAALAAATLLVALRTSPGARLLDDPAQDAWLKSGDPCYPVKQNKKYIESMGADSSYIRCVPLTVEVLWEVQEIYHHPAGLGTSRANYSIRDKYTASLELVYKLPASKDLASFQIMAPAPCCPGSVETSIESADVVLVVCLPDSRKCKLFTSNDSLHFSLEKPEDTTLGLTWNEDEGAHANFHSSRVQFKSAAAPKPYETIGGLEVLDSETHSIDVRGEPGFTPEDIDRLIRDGQFQEVFTDKQATTAPGLPVSGSQSVKATVKLMFTSDWEKWRVTVQGWEKDTIRPDIRYTQAGVEKTLPIDMEFDWTLEGEFIIRNPKKNPAFDAGQVTKAGLTPRLVFQAADLYLCTILSCSDTYKISGLVGAPLAGTVSGKNLTLTWPKFDPSHCLLCSPRKLFLGKAAYRQRFGSREFMRVISLQNLVLQNGYSTSDKYHDWMTYTISLKKIQ